MKQRVLWLSMGVLSPLLLWFWWGQMGEQPAAAAGKLDVALQTTLSDLAPGETTRFIVHLAGEATFSEATLPDDKLARRQMVVAELQSVAAAAQTSLQNDLDQLTQEGAVLSVQPLWIINALIITGDATAINTLAEHPSVTRITLDSAQTYLAEPTAVLTTVLPAELTWGLNTIRAAHAWYGLGVDGTGITVGIMDTGVDSSHPALQANYRGHQGGTTSHEGHWFDAVEGSPDPIDPNGHGTHVAGTAVGQGGIGVAPGANWIAVRMLDIGGVGYVSQIHQAFQWLMAPANNPALAPDVVNASWSSAEPTDTTFYADVQALQMAGILPIFAAGNNGPSAGTLGSPASLPGVFAVGATDQREEVTWFSSRGPSPMTNENKPDIVAPGAATLSSLPGGQYGYYSGTSMATPHVVGAAALLLSANPALTRLQVEVLLRETTVALDPPHPNSNTGYGRLDAPALVATQMIYGELTGRLLRMTPNSPPLVGVAITVTTPTGEMLAVTAAADGTYDLLLRPGLYTVQMTAWGYQPLTLTGVNITAGGVTERLLAPLPLPFAPVSGRVRDAQGQGITATLTAAGTPLTVQTGGDGRFSISLPLGLYNLSAAATGHEYVTLYVNVNNPSGHQVAFLLPDAPRILLVNDGLWHYQDFSTYYAQSLHDAGYGFDTFPVYSPIHATPTAEQLGEYDIVVWASPRFSPEYAGGGTALMLYLEEGGKALIFGPNAALFDSSGTDPQSWWYDGIRGRWVGRHTAPFNLTGQDGTPFAGLSFQLNGPGSADNHVETDEVEPQPDSLTEVVLRYGDGSAAALQSGLCDPFQMVYLGFGLEGVSPATARPQLLDSTFTWLQTPTNTVGIQLEPTHINELALPGSTHRYTITLQNTSETITDTYTIALSGATWNSSLVTSTVTIGPCQSGHTVVELTVPTGLPADTQHTFSLTATSGNVPSVSQSLRFQHKTPGHILFVDDDRFYDEEKSLLDALTDNGLHYDVWETGWQGPDLHSPPATLLPYYDMIFWYSGYDWFAPVTPAERLALEQYLAQGGRLFLTSQDFLYYHLGQPLAQTYFGVDTYFEEAAPTLVVADGWLRQAGLTQPLALDVTPYQNFGDGLVLGAGEPIAWTDTGLPGGVANQGMGVNGDLWRTVFLAFPLEKLPAEAQMTAINGMVGWLSDLGDSTFVTNEPYIPIAGGERVFTMTVRNEGMAAQTVTLVNSLPKFLDVQPGTVTGGAVYNAALRQLTWQGVVAAGGEKVIRYVAAAAPNVPSGFRLDNHLALSFGLDDFTWEQTIPLWVGVPDLRSSVIAVNPAHPDRKQPVTYTFFLHNDGVLPATTISSTFFLPLPLHAITDTLTSSGGTANLTAGQIHWQGGLAPGETVTVSLVLTATNGAERVWLGAAALIADGFTDPFLMTHLTPLLAPYQLYLPLLAKR